MKKKLAMTLMACTCLIEARSFAASSFPSGIYMGFGGSYSHFGSKMKDVTAQEVGHGDLFTIQGQKQDFGALGLTGLVGYLHVFPTTSFTLGGEIFWTLYKGEKTFHQSKRDTTGNGCNFDVNSRLRLNYEFGFKVLLGYLIDDKNHLYTLVGIGNKKFKENNELTLTNYAANQIVSNGLTSQFNKTYFLLGGGYERASGAIRYGIEGYYQLGKKNYTLQNSFFYRPLASQPTTQSPRTIDNSYTVMVKVSYNFGVFE